MVGCGSEPATDSVIESDISPVDLHSPADLYAKCLSGDRSSCTPNLARCHVPSQTITKNRLNPAKCDARDAGLKVVAKRCQACSASGRHGATRLAKGSFPQIHMGLEFATRCHHSAYLRTISNCVMGLVVLTTEVHT